MDLGLHTTLDDVNSKLDPEVLAISARITPQDAKEFGRVWDLFQARPTPFITDEFEILVRNYTQPEVRVQASGAAADWDTNNDITALPVNSADIDRITKGDVLRVGTEIVVVKVVNRGSNTIDVYERGVGESTAVAHGTGEITALIVGNAHEEGKADAEAMAEGTTKYTNYMQLVQEEIDLSHADSEQARKTGRTPETLKYEALYRITRDLARTAIHGVSRAPAAGFPAQTRGMLAWMQLAGGLQTNVGGAFTETALKGALNDVRVNGGSPSAIVMGVSKKTTFNTFTSADATRQDVNDRQAGRIIESYLADGLGSIPVVVDLDFPADMVAIVDSRKMVKGWKQGDDLRFEARTDVNPREKKELLHGKFGLAMENIGQSHALLSNLS